MKQIEKLALRIYSAMFEGQKSIMIEGKKHLVDCTSKAGIRIVDGGELRFIEQNPEKTSHWAEMAREGHKIMWVIKDGKYIAQVRDGIFHEFKSRSRKNPRNHQTS